MINRISKVYARIVLAHPVFVLIALSLLLLFSFYHSKNFQLDASADSLMLEDDQDLKIFREVNQRYTIRDFLVVTFTPREELFSRASLQKIKELSNSLKRLERVDSVLTLLDIPLLKTSDVKLSEITPNNIKTLQNSTVNVARAKDELLKSPIYRDLILSADGQTTALLINLKRDTYFTDLLNKRNQLRAKKRVEKLSEDDQAQLDEYVAAYDEYNTLFNQRRHQDIEQVRSIIRPYEQYAEVHLGGVPMIADDMITFIRHDLIVFGFGVFVFIVVTLTIIFREIRWVILPLLNCFFSVLFMVGMLGLLNWKVTVISSNFISLMLILTISMNIHLAERYRQLCGEMKDHCQRDIVFETVKKMVWPCFYTALTTILAFSSLVFSGIRPVIDFGWMMTIGLSVTFFASFVQLPAVLVLMKKSGAVYSEDRELTFISKLASVVRFHGGKVLLFAFFCLVISIVGIMKLKVENSFINYFSNDTEIYQGMKLIDDKLGGTNPLDVLVRFDDSTADSAANGSSAMNEEEEFSEEDEFEWITEYDPADYWFTPYKIRRIKEVHDYLDGLPEVGKVLSLASVVRVAEELNQGKAFDGLELGVLYKKIPDQIKSDMVDNYISIDNNEARISLRILDSLQTLRRRELLDRINNDLIKKLDFSAENITVTGILVLYNNMLQSLFQSQILTLGIVMLGIAAMLLILFRSFLLSIIGIVPNLLAVAVILGMMGLMNIPLDMMTITIAAITMGIGVDDCIHYIYRFREEFSVNGGDYAKTVQKCHRYVGKAIVNTSITIMFGFSILVMSNFIPTIYFGFFTGLAMVIALLAVLTVLPKLILVWRPFKSR